MILRKPYAFLIKNFKLIHFIMAILMGYLIYKTSNLLSFITDYLSTIATTITNDVTTSLFGPLFFVVLIFVIIGSIIILTLMKFKDKPIKFYIYNIITCLLLAIFYYASFLIIKSLESGLVDVRTLKIIHDLSLVALIVQGIDFIIVAIRATGFDIKSFDFKRDIEELNITELDNEEFEVDVEFDSNKSKRYFNKKLRYLKYAYLENKLLFKVLITSIIAVVSIILLLNFKVYNRVYKLNDSFKTNEFIMNYIDSYYTKYDINNNVVKDGYELVVVRFNIRNLYNVQKTLNTGNIYLSLGKSKYYHTTKYRNDLYDFGSIYNNQSIENNFKTYTLEFLVPENKITDKMFIFYTDTDKRKIKIDVTPKSLNKKQKEEEKSLTETLNLKNSILKNSTLVINSYEIQEQFALDYKYCIKYECFNYKEILKPGTDNNEKTVLMKLNGTLKLDYSNNRIDDLYKFIKCFGKIKYRINGTLKTMDTEIIEIKPSKAKADDYFIEIKEEIKSADEIFIEFNIRNKIYKYYVK